MDMLMQSSGNRELRLDARLKQVAVHKMAAHRQKAFLSGM